MITVVNKSKHIGNQETDIFIGRGSVFGNPYTGSKELSKTKALFQCENREEALSKYREYISEKLSSKDKTICDAFNKLYKRTLKENINLVCYCKPKDCHGDIIKEIIDAKIILKKLCGNE